MSKNEDYLDDLLSSVSKRNDKRDIEDLLSSIKEKETEAEDERDKKKREKRRKSLGDDFFKEFEQELLEDNDDEFIRDFELELDEEEADDEYETQEIPEADQDYISNIDGIMNEAKRKVNEEPSDELSEEELSEIAANTGDDLEDFTTDDAPADVSEQELDEPAIDLSAEQTDLEEDEEQLLPEDEAVSENTDDLLDMLEGLPDDPELSEIGNLLKADEEHEEVEPSEENADEFEKLGSIEELSDMKDAKTKKAKKEKKEKEKKPESDKKPGFFGKLLATLFGEDEADLGADSQKLPEEGMVDNLTDENMDILRELDEAATAASPQKEQGKAKKEKKEKKKKEKKPPKEKKPKKPKEPKPVKEQDNTPPLPKKPVILIFVMAISIFALIMLGTTLLGKSNGVSRGQELYEAGDYVGAYEQLAGMKLKGEGSDLYRKASILAVVQEEYNSYLSLMDVKEYEMALDSLIRGIGRYDKYYEEAQKYMIEGKLDELETQIEQMLTDQFGVSAEQARELYAMRKRDDYSIAIRQILDKLGLE